MRNLITVIVLIGLGYLGFSLIGGEDDPGPEYRPEKRILGQGGAHGSGGSDPSIPTIDPAELLADDDAQADSAKPTPAAGKEDDARPVPAVGEIATLEKRIAGTVSPENDEDRLRLAVAYLEAGQAEKGTHTLREIVRGGGSFAPRAAAALLPRTDGDERARLAASVVAQGPNAVGYDVAALIHGKELAAANEEAKQIEAWRLLSRAYYSRPDESWRRPIREVIEPIVGKWLISPRPCSLAKTYSVVGGDSLARIANSEGTTVDHLMAVNRLQSDMIHPGDRLKILDKKISIEVDKSEFRLEVRYDGGFLMSFPIGHGSDGRTPETTFVVDLRQEHPTWFPPNRPSIPYGDPANPLGERWLGFKSSDGFRGFGIHGTNEPETIGTEASEGCIRLTNEDVIALYPFVAVGTEVTITE